MHITSAPKHTGFTLVELMIVVGLIGLLAAIAVPGFIRARARSLTTTCINNLRQIESAKSRWALETKQAPNALPIDADLFGPSLYILKKPACPASGNYTIDTVRNPPTCDQPGHALD